MKHIIFILITMLALVACQDADIISNTGSPSQGDLRVAIRVPKFDDINVGTRGTKSGEESKVTNMYMFIIDNSGNIAYSQFEEGDKPLFTIDRAELAEQGKVLTAAKIVVVANVTDDVLPSLDAATNLAGIYACDYTLSSGTDCIDIPEKGFPMMSDEYPVDLHQPTGAEEDKLKGSVLEIPLKCLYAKIVFNISVQPTQAVSSVDQSFQVKSWKVYNIPTKVNLGVPADADQTKFAEENCEWVGSDARDNTNKADNLIYESSQESDSLTFHFYMPEHKVNPKYTANYPWKAEDNDKYLDYRQYLKPTLVKQENEQHVVEAQKATYVEINGIFKDHNNIEREVTYTIYLGADNYQNFHILRNHQYNNSVIIKGIKNSTAVGSTDWVTYDHRVNVKQDAFTFGLQRETLLDSHWEIRPIRIDFNNVAATDAVVEVIVPDDCDWLSIESPSATTISANATKANYCDVDNTSTAYGKRRYYTTNLNSDLKGTKKIVIHRDASKDKGHTIAKIDGHDAHTVWAYIDEHVNTTANAPQYRYATVTCNYYASEAAYNNGKGTPTVSEDYIFRQNNLHKIVYNGNTYYIEYYEEYLYNYDSKEQYGNTTDGMAWGMENKELSVLYPAAALDNVGGSGSNTLKNKVKAGLAKLPLKYDFYLQRDFDNNTEIPNANLTKNDDGSGKLFTKEIAESAKIDIKLLTTKDTPQSAIEYALNKNKRNPDGSIDDSTFKWYLPAIDEVEEICKGGYNQFEVFQDKLYWSSQPSFIRGIMDLYDRGQNAYHVQFFKEDSGIGYLNPTINNGDVVLGDPTVIYGKGRARATKVNDKFQTVKSESYGIQAAVHAAVTAPLIGNLDYLDIGFYYCYPGYKNNISFNEKKTYNAFLSSGTHTFNLNYEWKDPTPEEMNNYYETGAINNTKTTVTVYQGNKNSNSTYQADWKYYYYFYDEGNCSRDEIHRVRCAYK